MEKTTVIVPVNVTYYPMRARENILNELAAMLWDGLPERLQEEIQVEGNMLLSGVDMDIRFGAPIPIKPLLAQAAIARDIAAEAPIDFDDPIRSKPLMHRTALTVMKRYMAAIYGLTTVNYDHLQAAILRLIPTRTIDPRDFRGRVFLAAIQNFQQMGLWAHAQLSSGQIQLLNGSDEDVCMKFLAQAADKGRGGPSGSATDQGPLQVVRGARFQSCAGRQPHRGDRQRNRAARGAPAFNSPHCLDAGLLGET